MAAHHYFPATGRLPKVGRDEHLNVHGVPPRPAKTFDHHWSNAAQLRQALAHEQPITLQPSDDQSTPGIANAAAQPEAQKSPSTTVRPMTRHSNKLAVLAVLAAGLLPAATAQAQSSNAAYVQPAPL